MNCEVFIAKDRTIQSQGSSFVRRNILSIRKTISLPSRSSCNIPKSHYHVLQLSHLYRERLSNKIRSGMKIYCFTLEPLRNFPKYITGYISTNWERVRIIFLKYIGWEGQGGCGSRIFTFWNEGESGLEIFPSPTAYIGGDVIGTFPSPRQWRWGGGGLRTRKFRNYGGEAL